jgi:hypothetical protein
VPASRETRSIVFTFGCLARPVVYVYDKSMEIRLTPEIKERIRQHLVHECSGSPESILTRALQALETLEAMQAQAPRMLSPVQGEVAQPSSAPALLLVQWLHATAGPRMGLEEVRRRLAKIPGSMADAIREERDDRI